MTEFFYILDKIQEFIWGYIGIFLVVVLGGYFTLRSKFMQIRAFPQTFSYLRDSTKMEYAPGEIRPINAFFGSLGGCVGIGNVVTICLAIKIGGPGAVFWMWIVGFVGVMLKYSEVFLGIRYRIQDKDGKYHGGPMYFLQRAFPKMKWVAYLMAFLMCLYGVEIFLFRVLQESFSHNYNLDPSWVVGTLLVLVFYGVSGGLNKLGVINAVLIPLFMIGYVVMTIWVLSTNVDHILPAFSKIFTSAFSGHAILGGFLGSTFMSTVARGISGACYSGDVAIGYESIMHSEATIKSMKQQANLTILTIFLDTFVICTCTALMVVITGIWTTDVNESLMLQSIFSNYLPHIEWIMPVILFILGYTTIISYFYAGLVSAQFLGGTWGKRCFYVVGVAGFIAFSFLPTCHAATVMLLCGGGLMIINSLGIWKLRHHVAFD